MRVFKLFVLLLAFAAALLPRVSAGEDFLPPERAFRFEARAAGPDALEFVWTIAPGYYMYREQFSVQAEPDLPLGELRVPPGKVKFDQTFAKEVETYRDSVTVRLNVPAGAAFALLVSGQGCADAGLCYPPMQHRVSVTPAPAPGGLPTLGGDARPGGLFGSVLGAGSGGAADWRGLAQTDDVSLAAVLAGGGLLRTALIFLGLGVLLSLTPCVLPMVPILSAFVVGRMARDAGNTSRRLRGLGLAAAYVLGVSVVYTAVGVLAGLSGASLAASLQNPWVLGAFALLLAVLALSMFDVYTLQLPARWQSALAAAAGRFPGGQAGSAVAMGAVSALIVGPCVAAPLAGALLYISQTRDVVLGGLALFALAWGMGVPLLAAGASAGALLPRTGRWMNGVKKFFGVLLLGVAVWLAWPVLSPWLSPLWSSSLSRSRPEAGASPAAATSAYAPERVRTVAELDALLAASTQPVMLDFYADWCVSCKEMESFTFPQPEVAARLARLRIVQADVTANNADDQALLKRFRLFGPPGIMFFAPGGRQSDARVIGFQDAERFVRTLDTVLQAQ